MKKKNKMLWTQKKKNAKQKKKMKCIQGYLDRSRGVENLSRRSQPRWIENLSSIYQGDGNFLDGSKICQKAIEIAIKKS